MDSILDTLRTLFKGANPDASDEDINYQVKNYAQDPAVHDALKDLLPSTPDTQTESESTPPKTETSGDLTASPDLMNFKLPLANSVPSSFDVKESTSPVTMGGATPAMPTGNIPQPNNELPAPTPVETPPLPAMPAAPAPSATKPISKAAPSEPTQRVVEAPLAQNLSDDEERQKMLEEEARKRKLGILPILAGGAGDAISTAATAFGAQSGTPALDKIVDMESKNIKENREQFEEKLKNDPNSDVSKSYQKVIGLILGDKAKGMNVETMSANTIAKQLPEVEKFMAKQLQMEMIKATREATAANKQIALSEKEDQFNQRRWERFASAVNPMNAGSRRALGVAATNNMRADRLLATASNPTLTSQDYTNLVADLQGIYKGGVPDQILLAHGDYPSLQRKAGEIISYISGNPQAIHTPAVRDRLVSLTKELKDVDNKVINDNLGFNRVIFDELEKSDPEKFKRALESLGQMTVGVADNPQAPGAKPATSAAPTASPKIVIKKDPRTGKRYEVDPITKQVLREVQ